MPRRVRVDASVLADMLAYAAEPRKRRGALHAFLVAELCTLARPDAIVDISTAPERRQWWPSADTLALNQAGRVQTKKVRPMLPVLPQLREWLVATHADAEHASPTRRTGHWLVNYYGEPVQDVDRAWGAMLVALKLPLEREWRPYLLRHSLATALRGAGVPLWELSGFLGPRAISTTETYAVETAFSGVLGALQALVDDLEHRAPGALHRSSTGSDGNVIQLGRR